MLMLLADAISGEVELKSKQYVYIFYQTDENLVHTKHHMHMRGVVVAGNQGDDASPVLPSYKSGIMILWLLSQP